MRYEKLVKYYPDFANDKRFSKLDFILASRIQNLIDWDENMYDGFIGNPESIKSRFHLSNYSTDEIANSLIHLLDLQVFECKELSPKNNVKRFIFTPNQYYSPIQIDIETGELL